VFPKICELFLVSNYIIGEGDVRGVCGRMMGRVGECLNIIEPFEPLPTCQFVETTVQYFNLEKNSMISESFKVVVVGGDE
jgi:hypothetical protein